MKSITVKQRCNQCGETFDIEYFENGTYRYLGNPCVCDSEYSPIGGPSISEWLQKIKVNTAYIVAMKERGDDEMSIWAAPFTSREKADAFVEKVKKRLKKFGVENEWQIDIDSGELDDEQYLDWIDARYEGCEEGEEE